MRRPYRSALLLGALALAVAACGKGKADGGDAEKKTEAVPVEIATLERGPIEQVLRFSTGLEAERAVPVRAEAARQVVALLVEEGHRVARGQTLLRLEDTAQTTAVSRAEGQVEQARREHDRKLRLFEQKMLSEQEMTAARYDLEQRELALADARRELSYTTVRAPIAGTVTNRHVRVGDTVAVNQQLFDLVDFDSLVALVFVPEREVTRVRVGQAARLMPPAAPGNRFEGRVDRIAPVVDPKSGTVKVTVTVPNAPGLLPGMFLEVELVTAVEPDALLVPKRALVPDGTQLTLWRLADEETVERLWVEPVLEDREKVSVATGLAPGDRIVVAGQAGLKAGAKVRVVGAAGGAG